MSRRFLRLRFDNDHDGTGHLTVEARCEKFAGEGTACFSVSELEKFADQLRAYPLPSVRPEIRGGYWSQERKGTLDQELVGLAAYPTNLRGDVAIQVRVMTGWWEGDRPESQSRATFEVPLHYGALRALANELIELVRGERREVHVDPDGGAG